jgi:hypothetical protein
MENDNDKNINVNGNDCIEKVIEIADDDDDDDDADLISIIVNNKNDYSFMQKICNYAIVTINN